MATMNISLPDQLSDYVKSRIDIDGYQTVSEYFRHLVREDQKSKTVSTINNLIEEALNSPSTPLTYEDWLNLRLKLEQHRAKK
jgi:antitoxin ParD1/3/4